MPGVLAALAALVARGSAIAYALDLPRTAGAWLSDRVAAFGAPLSLIVTTTDRDTYHPRAAMIQLGADTYFKNAVEAWTDAAYQLGHAHTALTRPRFTRAWRFAHGATSALTSAGIGFAAGRILYALPATSAAAVACFLAAAALRVCGVVESAYACATAYRELTAGDGLPEEHHRAARRILRGKLARRAADFVGYLLLPLAWPVLERLASAHGPALRELTTLGWIGAAVASLSCAVDTVLQIVRMVSSRVDDALDIRRGGWTAALTFWLALVWGPALLWLIWDHRSDAAYAWCAVAAIAASGSFWRCLISQPIKPLLFVALLLPGAILAGGVDRSAALESAERCKAARAQASALIKEGDQTRWRTLYLRPGSSRPWQARIGALAALGHVPLLVAFWLT